MDDLEAEIRRWCDAQVTGVEPVTPGEAVSLARSHHRARRLIIVAAAALLIAATVGGAVIVGFRRDGPVNVKTGGTGQSVTTMTMCQRITTVPSTVPPLAGTDNPLLKASLAPHGKVAVGNPLTHQTGWVTWAAFQDDTRPAPVTNAAGHLVGYFANILGWINVSAYNKPCFNYPALLAAARSKIDAEAPALARLHARSEALADLVDQYAAVSRQAGPVASLSSSEPDPPSPTDPEVTTYQLKDAKGTFSATASLNTLKSTLTVRIGTDEYDFVTRGNTFVPVGHHVSG